MKRARRLLCATALAPLATPLWGLAQSTSRVRRIGHLSLSKADAEVALIGRNMIRESLWRLGWEDGKNLSIERRYADGDATRLDQLARELVRSEVELIIASLSPPTAAAQRATQTIPIVMVGTILPEEVGFVQSLARPGGNITGTAVQVAVLYAKTFQFMHELAPRRTRIAHLSGPIAPGAEQATRAVRREVARAAQTIGLTIEYIDVKATGDIGGALERIAASRAELLYVVNSGVIEPRLREITEFAIRNKILSSGSFTLFTSVGGAVYYGPNLQDIFDRSMSFVDRILRGAKPGDLPVELPSRFDLILHLTTLRALGITVPRTMLLQATEVIE